MKKFIEGDREDKYSSTTAVVEPRGYRQIVLAIRRSGGPCCLGEEYMYLTREKARELAQVLNDMADELFFDEQRANANE